jgi:hypothetical protein
MPSPGMHSYICIANCELSLSYLCLPARIWVIRELSGIKILSSVFLPFTKHPNTCGNFFQPTCFPNPWSSKSITYSVSPKCLILNGLTSLDSKGMRFSKETYPSFISNALRKWDLYENGNSPLFHWKSGLLKFKHLCLCWH